MSGRAPEVFETKKCYESKCENECTYCYVNANKSQYSRKCFMTGEYCSKQASIQRERSELHKENEINAFVIMSFSDMTDVVYEWRIKRFIKKLKMYLAFDKDRNRICCSKEKLGDETQFISSKINKEENEFEDKNEIKYYRVKEIHVERGDSDVASNYVMCSRVCQRIQIADLIVVDVSHQNPNVFYELGMAIALGKMILPICFSESYYKMSMPKSIKETDGVYSEIEHHIGCYPWRKDLFEYFGIFHTKSENGDRKTSYLDYKVAINPIYGFSDMQYNHFPYDAKIEKKKKNPVTGNEEIYIEKIGEKLYKELQESYNNTTKRDNTLLVYTLDGFLNEEEAGICIVNFYHTITAKVQAEQCFCGDRVGVLVQGKGIPDPDKDSDKQIDLFYSIGEIIHIGVNQATYLSEKEKLKADDVIFSRKFNTEQNIITEKQGNGILRAVKGYMRNRGIIIYPKNPVYVKRELDKLIHKNEEKILEEKNILERSKVCNCSDSKVTCLYHKVLHSLRYVNEVVIDISYNTIHSLFWLGIAHGSNVNAITVLYDATEEEREKITGNKEKKQRIVFDVAGLWTAILHSNDTQGFYNQLAQAQHGIENHEKLMLKNKSIYEKKLHDKWREIGKKFIQDDIEVIYKEEKNEISRKLESYYRSRFWNTMLRHNQLLICMPQIEHLEGTKEEPRGYTSKWDFKASSILSRYLSKRTVISEYSVEAIAGKEAVNDIEQRNFISLGAAAKPLGKTLPQYILSKVKKNITIYVHSTKKFSCHKNKGENSRSYKGFKKITKKSGKTEKNENRIYTQHPQYECNLKCKNEECVSIICNEKIIFTPKLKNKKCSLRNTTEHIEMAQLIIWRESSNNIHEKTVFRVAINGSSGPATLGLSTIFVGDDQKLELIHENAVDNPKILLCDLQEDIRKEFMDRYRKELYKKIDAILFPFENKKGYDVAQITRYRELVWYAVSMYLLNEMYRYFLPLLSDKNIYSLCNGMYNFVNYMRMENESPFDINYLENEDIDFPKPIDGSDVDEVIKEIPKVLYSLLSEFQGIEAFYKVKVRHHFSKEEKREDTREVLEVSRLNKKDYVKCLWVENEESKNECRGENFNCI